MFSQEYVYPYEVGSRRLTYAVGWQGEFRHHYCPLSRMVALLISVGASTSQKFEGSMHFKFFVKKVLGE